MDVGSELLGLDELGSLLLGTLDDGDELLGDVDVGSELLGLLLEGKVDEGAEDVGSELLGAIELVGRVRPEKFIEIIIYFCCRDRTIPK